MTQFDNLSYEEAVQEMDSERSNGHFEPSDYQPPPDDQEIIERLENLSNHEKALLNHLVHWSGQLPDFTDHKPDQIQASIRNLLSLQLIIPSGTSRYIVPSEVLYQPNGPGNRWNQLSGFWHRLPSTIRQKLSGDFLVEASDGEHNSFPDFVRNSELRPADREFLKEIFQNAPWVSQGHLESDEFPLEELPEKLKNKDHSVHEAVCRGQLFPVWNNKQIVIGYTLNQNLHEAILSSSEMQEIKTSELPDKQWERRPFPPSDQIKALLILCDALPFRATQDGYPHLFDLKEASQITNWNRKYLHTLIHICLEQNLIAHDDGRFYMTEESAKGLGSENLFHLNYSRAPLGHELESDNCEYLWKSDYSLGFIIDEFLQVLEKYDQGVSKTSFTQKIVQNLLFHGHLSANLTPEGLEDHDNDWKNSVINSYLMFLFQIGLVDYHENEEGTDYIRINSRGRDFLQKEASSDQNEETEDLPIILQPDGKLMIPMNAPLRYFRKVNPFALLTKIDQMVEYRLDRQGLVQALNKGWDAHGIQEFLQQHATEIPDPVGDLFDDVLDEVEEVNVENVYHLLEFRNGATAAKALNALNNYNPERIGEEKILLHSKTTEETIRRNLARGGIRLQSTSTLGAQSPLIDPGQ